MALLCQNGTFWGVSNVANNICYFHHQSGIFPNDLSKAIIYLNGRWGEFAL